MILNEFDTEKSFFYENGFYVTSQIDRMGKFLAHYELYKRIVDLPGQIIECGVFKGNSLQRLATFRELLENPFSRKIIGFDIFGKFPDTNFKDDKQFLDKFISSAGDESIQIDELEKVFEFKGLKNIELVKGNINNTVPDYVKKHPQLKIAFLHIDTDVYEPAVTILNTFYKHVVKGGLIVFDDYGTFPGETKAVDDFFAGKDVEIKKLPFYQVPSFIVKNEF
ncbi:MAG: class I SAM-dependent methyltransferase [Cyclobacteriaceae bacterium]|nr:class I SAM-dependent methyltransferase [Cyclobacteriaceae bacterium]